jgi:hypothetical protein
MGKKLKNVGKQDLKVLDEAIRILKAKKVEIESNLTSLKSSCDDYASPVTFDIGVNTAFLEIDGVDEVKNFYKLSNPSPQTLLIGKVVMGLLGKWDLILTGSSSTIWKSIQSYFKMTMGYNICTLSDEYS